MGVKLGPESRCPVLRRKVQTVIRSPLFGKSVVVPSCSHLYNSKGYKDEGVIFGSAMRWSVMKWPRSGPFCVHPETPAQAAGRIGRIRSIVQLKKEWDKFPRCSLCMKV